MKFSLGSIEILLSNVRSVKGNFLAAKVRKASKWKNYHDIYLGMQLNYESQQKKK